MNFSLFGVISVGVMFGAISAVSAAQDSPDVSSEYPDSMTCSSGGIGGGDVGTPGCIPPLPPVEVSIVHLCEAGGFWFVNGNGNMPDHPEEPVESSAGGQIDMPHPVPTRCTVLSCIRTRVGPWPIPMSESDDDDVASPNPWGQGWSCHSVQESGSLPVRKPARSPE